MTQHKFKTTNIKGKEYVEVNQRLLYFRTATEFQGWSLETEILSSTDQSCIMRAIVRNQEGRIMATGHAQEDRTSSMINKTSYVENCETSCWGRVMANLGIGITPEIGIASAEEVEMAIAKQALPVPVSGFAGPLPEPEAKRAMRQQAPLKKVSAPSEAEQEAKADFEQRLGLQPTIDEVIETERLRDRYKALLLDYHTKGGRKAWPNSQDLTADRLTKGIEVLTTEIASL